MTDINPAFYRNTQSNTKPDAPPASREATKKLKKKTDKGRKGLKQDKLEIAEVSALVSGTANLKAAGTVPAPPSIAELARALKYDVDLIYEWVYSNVDFYPVWGSHKGALGALIDRSASSCEQSALMIALLRESGYTCNFVFGFIRLDKEEVELFLGCQDTTVETAAETVLNYGQIEAYPVYDTGVLQYIDLIHAYVQVDIDGTDYVFDPSYKLYDYTTGIDIGAAVAFNEATLITDAEDGATVTSDYIENLNKANIQSLFETYGTNLLDWINTNAFDASMADIIGGRVIEPLETQPVRQTSLPYQMPGDIPFITADMPTGLRATYEVLLPSSLYYGFYTDEIYGQRLTFTFDPDMYVELRFNGELLATSTLQAPTDLFFQAYFQIIHWPFASSFADQVWVQPIYGDPDGIYLLGASYGITSQSMVDTHTGILQQNIADGGGDADENVIGESLDVLWFMYTSQCSQSDNTCDQLGTTIHFNYHIAGICGYESFHQGPYFDIAGVVTLVLSRVADDAVQEQVATAGEFIHNGFEAGILQQMSAKTGINTQRLLSAANADAQKTFDATSSNWYGGGGIRGQLVNWSSWLSTFDSLIDGGARLIIHEDGETTVEDYVGGGLLINTGLSYSGQITGGILGGALAVPESISNLNDRVSEGPLTTNVGDKGKGSPPPRQCPVGAFTGALFDDFVDVAVGSSEFPYALEFSRSYNSDTRFTDGVLGLGWTHNFATSVKTLSNGFRAFGEYSPKECAAAIAHAYVLIQLDVSADGTLTKVLIAAMSSLWLMDETTNNAVQLQDGGQLKTFIRLLDDSYSPPPGYADTLVDNLDGTFSLTSPQRLVWNFNQLGNLDTYVDPAGVTVTLGYDVDNRLETVTNGLGRTLTLNYTDDRLSSVSDGNDREVLYTVDGSGNLTEFTDAEGNTYVYSYLAPGQMESQYFPENPAIAVVTNTYDSLGRVMTQTGSSIGTAEFFFAGSRSEVVDTFGNRTAMYFNTLGSMIRSIDALMQETTYEFDGLNRLAEIVLPEANTIQLSYDEQNNILSRTWSPKPGSPLDDIVQLFAYDTDWNKVSSFTDGEGNETTFEYDPIQGTLLTITRPVIDSETPVVTFTYNARGQMETRTDETDIVDKYEYHLTNETLLSVTNDFGVGRLNLVTAFDYDDVGNCTSMTDPRGNTTTLEFDAQRQQITRTECSPFDFITTFEYDDNGNLVLMRRETGEISEPHQDWTYSYKADKMLESMTDPAGFSTSLVYDANNWLVSKTSPEGNQWQYQYDQLGRLVSVTNPLEVVAQVKTYTENGMLATITDARANTTTIEYDGLDRLQKIIYPDSTFEEFSYDANNQVLTTLTRNNDTLTCTYDVLTRLSTRQPGSSLALQTFEYDLSGRILNINTPISGPDPASGDYEFSYDTAGRLLSQIMPNTNTVSYQLDENGNRTRLIWPDSYYAEYVFDELNRLTDIKLNGSSSPAIHFDYDDLSRRSQITYENGCVCTYAYSINNDITSLQHDFVGSSVNFGLAYNAVHQPISLSIDDTEFMWRPTDRRSTAYGAANELNQYPSIDGVAQDYDPNGCLIAGPFDAAFDALNRLTELTKDAITSLFYNDPLNRQAQKEVDSVKTSFLYDKYQLIADYDALETLLHRYIPSATLDEILIQIADTTTTYFHQDHLGSTIAQTNDSGTVLNKYRYAPFGQTGDLAGATFGFTGQRYDAETGLYNFKARYCAPDIGRFLQPDPIGYMAGMNLYTYVSNMPTALTDPFGLKGISPTQSAAQTRQNIAKIKKSNKSFGDKVVDIAKELGRQKGRFHQGQAECNLLVHGALQAAGEPLPQKPLDVAGLDNYLERHPSTWSMEYVSSPGDTTATLQSQYIPRNGDIAVWNNQNTIHIAVVQATADGVGNLIYAGSGAPSGAAITPMNIFSDAPNYGPPTVIYRHK